MKRTHRPRILPLAALLLLLGAAGFAQGERPGEAGGEARGEGAAPSPPVTVAQCELSGTVDAGMAEYLADCVRIAEERGYEALLLRLDTPGGALDSTREITQAFLTSQVPVLVWVGPAGARAGSAGVFITLSSHLAAMAPGTNIGAAHPVMGPSGADPEEGGSHMARKVENDTAAYAEALAEQRGRNAEWAIEAVRESASVPDHRALELGVVEISAPTEADFLMQADGRTVQLPGGERVLRTADARIEHLQPSMRQALVHWLANPSIAYLLFVIGGLGLAIELTNPGGIVPGVVGLVFMILAMIAFSALPIQTGALLLLLAGIGLIVAEFFVGSGLLAVGGVGLLVLGGALLVDPQDLDWSVDSSFGVPWSLLIPTAVLLGGAAVYVVWKAAATRKVPQQTGDLGMIGQKGRALSPIDAESGMVFVFGERWQARSAEPIAEGEKIVVSAVEGLTLRVEKAE